MSAQPTYISDAVDIEYRNQQSETTTQAVYTTTGFVCLGFGLRPSYCASGAALDAATATCADGTPTTTRATEFDFALVRAGTTEPMPPMQRLYTTFYDVDGEFGASGSSLYEYVSVLNASSLAAAPSTSLAIETFEPSGVRYAVSSSTVNAPTDFTASPITPAIGSTPAIVAFEL